MGRELDIGLAVLVLAVIWLAAAVVVAAGLHLFRRIDVMLGYGYGWKDAGVQLRATRRRRDKRLSPVTEKLPYQEWIERQPVKPMADRLSVPRTASGETMIIHHAGKETGLWGAGPGGGSFAPGPAHGTNGRPPWRTADQPAVTEDTMTLARPVEDGH